MPGQAYAVHAKAHICVRLVGGVASEIEVDRVEILSVQEVKEADPAAK